LHCALLLGGAAFLFEQAAGNFGRRSRAGDDHRRWPFSIKRLVHCAAVVPAFAGSDLKTPVEIYGNNHSTRSAGRGGADDKPSLISRYDIFAVAAVPS
jgi:hypothetical protein